MSMKMKKKIRNFILLSQTRWLSKYNAIERICTQYLELQTHISIVCDIEKCHSARMLNETYRDTRNILILQFLRPILKQINTVNLYFQNDKVDLHEAYLELESFIMVIVRKIIKKDFLLFLKDKPKTEDVFVDLLNNPIALLSDDEIDFGSNFLIELKKSKLSQNEIHKLKMIC